MSKLNGETYRNILLCVDSYDHGELKGRYYNPGLEGGGREFESLSQLLIGVENMFNSSKFPQSFTATRSFAPISEPAPSEIPAPGTWTGKCGTFKLRIMFRQHTSWQGSVTWVEGKGEQMFRSVLELVLLLDSALGGGKGEMA